MTLKVVGRLFSEPPFCAAYSVPTSYSLNGPERGLSLPSFMAKETEATRQWLSWDSNPVC